MLRKSLKMKMNYFSIHFWPKFHKNKVGVNEGVKGAEIKFYYTSLDIEFDWNVPKIKMDQFFIHFRPKLLKNEVGVEGVETSLHYA